MCGILGVVASCGVVETTRTAIKKALDLLAHRGPDGEGILVKDSFIFGHRRLAIIDLRNEAAQPMVSSDGRVSVTFNGEIYNYIELREQLIGRGYRFHSSSDTEVLLNLYHCYGLDCLEKLVGMFAFAIHDERSRTTYVVRDRLGIKPVYYSRENDQVIFASEIKSILSLKKAPNRLSPLAVSSYLSYRYPVGNNTFFEGISSVPPGHYITIDRDGCRVSEYWSVFRAKAQDEIASLDEGQISSKVMSLLEDAVRVRMRADVPVGAFLSGGVDSSAVVGLMSRFTKEPIHTYTIGFPDEGYSEQEFANVVAEIFHTNHRTIETDGSEYFSLIQRLIEFKDAPLSVPNEIPLYQMCKQLREQITVVLSGEGADEIFGGYGRIFRSPYDFERLKSGAAQGVLAEKLQKKLGRGSFIDHVDFFLCNYEYSSASEKSNLLHDGYCPDDEVLNEPFYSAFSKVADHDFGSQIGFVFEKLHLPGLLARLDMTTMANSVEGRVPFVDHRLVEFALSIPYDNKLRWKPDGLRQSTNLTSDEISEVLDTPKYILKKSLEDLLPDSILYRKKVGFPVPLQNWLGGGFKEVAEEILLDGSAHRRGIYNMKGIKAKLANPQLLEDHSSALKIWMMMNLEIFCSNYSL